MRPSNALNNNQGFTLLETTIVIVVISILFAIAAPSYLAWSQRKKVDSAISSIEGAIKESQRRAMSMSRTCNVAFTTTLNTPRVTSDPITNTCLITGDRILSSVSMQVSKNDTSLTTTGATPISFDFDYLGNNNNSDAKNITVVISHNQNTNLKRCLVVSYPLGLIGTGRYTGTGSSISANCTR
ncbi:MAG: type II secretion system protein [Nostocales cyanobacterium]|nr:MAG: type II secretion system protein [Nostocales cyanobacterium]